MEGTDARGCAGAGPRTVMDNGISNSKWSERMEGPNARGCAEAVPGTVGNDVDNQMSELMMNKTRMMKKRIWMGLAGNQHDRANGGLGTKARHTKHSHRLA
jgi:hypothetical protein